TFHLESVVPASVSNIDVDRSMTSCTRLGRHSMTAWADRGASRIIDDSSQTDRCMDPSERRTGKQASYPVAPLSGQGVERPVAMGLVRSIDLDREAEDEAGKEVLGIAGQTKAGGARHPQLGGRRPRQRGADPGVDGVVLVALAERLGADVERGDDL